MEEIFEGTLRANLCKWRADGVKWPLSVLQLEGLHGALFKNWTPWKRTTTI